LGGSIDSCTLGAWRAAGEAIERYGAALYEGLDIETW